MGTIRAEHEIDQGKKLAQENPDVNVVLVPFDWLHPAIPEKAIKDVFRIGQFIEKTPIIREFSGSLFIRAQKPE